MAPGSTSHCTNPAGIRRGAWSKEEDVLLTRCIDKYGEGNWHLVPSRAGLRRCRKSCRLRWLNYLSPNIKRGPFAPDEDDLIVRMHRLLGNRWSLIAGRMPGRTANGIKNRWNSHLVKNMVAHQPPKEAPPIPSIVVVKPQAHRPNVKAPPWFKRRQVQTADEPAGNFTEQFCFSSWFDPMSIQGRGEEVGRGGGGRLEAPHQTREGSLLPETLLDLHGKESPLPGTSAPTQAELEWLPDILLDLDGKESSLQATAAPTQAELEWPSELSHNLDDKEIPLQATTAPTQAELEWLPEILLDLDGNESSLQATEPPTQAELEWLPEIPPDLDGKEEFPVQGTTAPTQAEFEWANLLSDPEFWSSLDISGRATFQPGGAHAPPNLPKS